MATISGGNVFAELRKVLFQDDGAGLSDAQLLTCFIEQRDEAAFEALLRRHGPMVLGVCRRILRRVADVEDAFQATFLVFVRKAAAIRSRETVGNWLYGVAYNTALKARALNARRDMRERNTVDSLETVAVQEDSRWHELQPLLDRELSRLPDKHRLPIVLCDLEGKPRKDAAQQLGLAEGTLSSRLTRGRALLAGRLAHHGVVLSGSVLGALLLQSAASASLPAPLVSATLASAIGCASGQIAAGTAISERVAALTKGVLTMMWISKFKTPAVMVVALAFVLAGAAVTQVLVAGQQPTGKAEEAAGPAAKGVGQGAKAGTAKEDPTTDNAPKDKVKALLKEKLTIVMQRAEMTARLAQLGGTSQEELANANLRVFAVELELCETDKERVAVHEKIVKIYTTLEEMARRSEKNAVASHEEALEATMKRLDAEIALERAKARAAEASK
jgi:RNA polymerase sigma factor (sigma-70 family)